MAENSNEGSRQTAESARAAEMDQAFFCEWFRGFGEGLDEMEAGSRSALLKHCARRCADTGVLQAYMRLHRAVSGDRDAFYRRLSEIGNVRGEITASGREYRICFPDCTCDIHTAGRVNTPHLCECSRQSILYVAEKVWKDCRIRVETEETILSGASECRFRIIFE